MAYENPFFSEVREPVKEELKRRIDEYSREDRTGTYQNYQKTAFATIVGINRADGEKSDPMNFISEESKKFEDWYDLSSNPNVIELLKNR